MTSPENRAGSSSATAASGEKTRCLTPADLARVLGVNRSQVTRWRRFPWFPPADPDLGWNPEAARAAVVAHLPRSALARRSGDASPGASSGVPRVPKIKKTDALIRMLRSGTATPLELARASAQLAARTYADALVAGTLQAQDLDNLKKTLQELRNAEGDYLALDVRRGELIERDAAKAVIGRVAARYLADLDALPRALPPQVEAWMESEPFRAQPAADRARAVREWSENLVRRLRSLTADDIEAALAEESGQKAPEEPVSTQPFTEEPGGQEKKGKANGTIG